MSDINTIDDQMLFDLSAIAKIATESLGQLKDILRVKTALNVTDKLLQLSVVYSRRDGEEVQHFFINDIAKFDERVKQTYDTLKANNDAQHYIYLQGVAVEMALEAFRVVGTGNLLPNDDEVNSDEKQA